MTHVRPDQRQAPARACPGGIGLTTALSILHGGWVVVGSLPTTNGMAATAKAGCLLVLDRWGHVRETLSGYGINGPWDMTAISNHHFAQLFVTNVLNGTVAANGKVVNKGTVLRLTLAPCPPSRPASAARRRSGPDSGSAPTRPRWSSGPPAWG